MVQKNDLFDYKNRMIFQDSDFFKFSLDSILLAEFTRNMHNNKRVLDLCTGNCAVPLICTTFNNSHFYGFEISNSVYNLGKKSIEYNKLNDLIEIINDDVNNYSTYFENEYFDYVVCNPPYFKYNENSIINTNEEKSYARHEIKLNLEQIFSISYNALKSNGILFMVHRPERIDDIIYLSKKNNLNIKYIQFICSNSNDIPNIVLCKFVKNSKSGVKYGKYINVSKLSTYQGIFEEVK